MCTSTFVAAHRESCSHLSHFTPRKYSLTLTHSTLDLKGHISSHDNITTKVNEVSEWSHLLGVQCGEYTYQGNCH